MKNKINTTIINPYLKIFGIILFFTIVSFLFEFQRNITIGEKSNGSGEKSNGSGEKSNRSGEKSNGSGEKSKVSGEPGELMEPKKLETSFHRQPLNTNYIGIFIFRFIHYLMLFYFAVFLLFFKEKGQDAYIYILSALILSFSWFLFDCCIVSYHELLFYGVNHNDYITSFHPCLYVVFNTYQWIPLMISGVIMFFTVFYLLWKNTAISLTLRVFIGGVFFFLFIYNLVTTRYYDSKLKYPLDSEHRLYKYFTLPTSIL